MRKRLDRSGMPVEVPRGSLANRRFVGYLVQGSSARSATNVAQVCLTWFVYACTSSAIDVGLVALANSLATLIVTLPVGSIVDRFNRGKLLIGSSAIATFSFAFIACFTHLAGFSLSMLICLASIWSASMELFRSTNNSVLPDLVASNDLSKANGISSSFFSSIGSISSAVAGSIIVIFGIIAGFSYSVIGYAIASIVSAITIYPFFRKKCEQGSDGESKPRKGIGGALAELNDGFKWLIQQRGLWQLTISACIFNFFSGIALAYLVVYVAEGVHAGSLVYGIVVALMAAGSVLGSILAGYLRVLSRAGKLWVVVYGLGAGITILVMGVFPALLTAAICAFLLGTVGSFAGTIWLTSAQNLVPSTMRGRYFAIDGLFSIVGSPISIAVGSIVISNIGVNLTLIIMGGLMCVSAIPFILLRGLWRLDGHPREKGLLNS